MIIISKQANLQKAKFQGNGKRKIDNFREIGVTGTSIFSGVIDEEYLSEWSYMPSRIDQIEKMMRGDGQIMTMVLVVELPIRATDWYVEPVGEEEEDQRIADFISWNLFEGMTITWDDFLRQALSHTFYGFSIFEKVFEYVEDPGQWGGSKGMVKLRKLAPRLQKTIDEWKVDETGGISQVVQKDPKTYESYNLPIEKLIVFSHRKEGSNFEGVSLLRSAYKHWFIKDKLYIIEAIGLERNAVQTPVIEPPGDDEGGITEDALDYAQKLLHAHRVHEEAGVIKPKGFSIEYIGSNINSMALHNAIRHHDAEMVKSILAQFVEYGLGKAGTQALIQGASKIFYQHEDAIAKYIADNMNRYVIPQLVRMNWNVDKFPRLDFVGTSGLDNEELSKILKELADGEILAPYEELEDYLIDRLKLPEKIREKPREESKEKPKEEPGEMEGLEEERLIRSLLKLREELNAR